MSPQNQVIYHKNLQKCRFWGPMVVIFFLPIKVHWGGLDRRLKKPLEGSRAWSVDESWSIGVFSPSDRIIKKRGVPIFPRDPITLSDDD